MAASERSIDQQVDMCSSFLQKFRLYETRSNFYMIGRDKNRTFWRVLKLDRTDPTDLNIYEDSTAYTEAECFETLRRIHEGNRSSGGLKFVTTCYGIIGFIKFLGPYYMLMITKRRKLGEICGHTVYGVAKSKIITIPHASVLTNVAYSKDEKRSSYVTSACKMENLYLGTVITFRNYKTPHLYLDSETMLLSFFLPYFDPHFKSATGF